MLIFVFLEISDDVRDALGGFGKLADESLEGLAGIAVIPVRIRHCFRRINRCSCWIQVSYVVSVTQWQ